MPGSGFVYLVGAGPGDPRLLTLRAYELLRSVEVVAHDELVTPEILALVPPDVERLAVGRRSGHGKTTYRVHPDVLERARAGQTVVRLKCGDPFTFGRGGEEAQELSEAGIGYEVVPGVSAALGAAAYAGIPLTHRLHASTVTFATGHDALSADRPGGQTIVLFMPVRRLAQNLEQLMARGLPPETPAAYVASATTRRQRVVTGTLADLSSQTEGIDPSAPALLIVGEVVSLRDHIAWFESRPLAGRRLLVARARPGRSRVAAELRALGAEVLEVPDIAVELLDKDSGLEVLLRPEDSFHGIVFACAAGVDAVAPRLRTAAVPIFAIGAETERALIRYGIEPSVSVRGACLEALREHQAALKDRKLLVVTSEDGRPSLTRALAELGAFVEPVAAYRHVHRRPPAPLPPIDLVVLPCSSSAHAALSIDLGQEWHDVPMVAMGPRTEEAARRCGARIVFRAEEDSLASLVSSAVSALGAA